MGTKMIYIGSFVIDGVPSTIYRDEEKKCYICILKDGTEICESFK
jgi:hypothetical protein